MLSKKSDLRPINLLINNFERLLTFNKTTLSTGQKRVIEKKR